MKIKDESARDVLNRIIVLEEEMFTAVKTSEPSLCQTRLNAFRMMRTMSFSVLAKDTLEAYLKDLLVAKAQGRNLVTEKYARMDNLIPVINTNPIIAEIVRIELRWLECLQAQYPYMLGHGGNFVNYEQSELETYSDETLSLYYRDLSEANLQQINLVEKRYLNLYEELGYQNLEAVEKKAKESAGVK